MTAGKTARTAERTGFGAVGTHLAAGSPVAGGTQVVARASAGPGWRPRAGRALAALLLIGLGLVPLQSSAECACRCIDGQLRTACTSIAEAGAQPDLCPRVPLSSCPQHPEGAPPASYPAPDEAAGNCRNVALYDPERGGYVTRRACDVP